MRCEQARRPRELTKIELTVAVGQEHLVHPGVVQARSHRRAVASIPEVGHHPKLGNFRAERREDRGRVIRAAIVHDDDFQVGSEVAPDAGCLADYTGDVSLLVETGNLDDELHVNRPACGLNVQSGGMERGTPRGW